MKPTALFGALVLAVSLAVAGCDSAFPTDASSGVVSDAGPGDNLSGAIFTTNAACTGTNVNQFASKAAVYVDGGPRREGSAGLPAGFYWIQVTEPNGTVLGRSSSANVEVNAAGKFVDCYQLQAVVELVDGAGVPNGTPGYATATNGGGVYKVWVSRTSAFAPSESKTDNFKVAGAAPPDPTGTLTVLKYYDANANGTNDGEAEIVDWKILIDGFPFLTRYTDIAAFGSYGVAEAMPVEANWFATQGGPFTVTVSAATPNVTVEFGNVCVGAGNGRTLGYWSNRNGQALMDGNTGVAYLRNLSVPINPSFFRTADGSSATWTTYAAFRTWLLGANATNMAYMLSAQLAAMELNVRYGGQSASALIYAPGTSGANAAGFAPLSVVMGEARASLAANGSTPAGHGARTYQEALKNALDNGNNNRTFVQASPCPFTFAD